MNEMLMIDCVVMQYLLLMLSVCAVMAWFGSLIDNLLLTYLIGMIDVFVLTNSDV